MIQSNSEIAFLFDLDGVLIDSEQKYTLLWQEIERVYPTGIKNFPIVIKGTTLHEILDNYFSPDVRDKVESLCIEAERKLHYEYTPGARELLSELKRRGIPTVLVTSSDKAKMDALRIKLPDIFNWFDGIVYGEMVTKGKPHPEPYLKGAAMAGVKADNCIVVEDSLTGMHSGRDAGALVIGMTSTLGRDAVEDHADIILDTLVGFDVDGVIANLKSSHGV